MPLAPEEAPADDELALAKDAAMRCAGLAAILFGVTVDALYQPTRGSPRQAFARMVWMAGLSDALGLRVVTIAQVVGRTRDTIEHACVVIDALRFLPVEDLIHGRYPANAGVFSEADVLEFFGDENGLVDMLGHAGPLIRDAFAAFVLVGVRGPAFSRALAERQPPRKP